MLIQEATGTLAPANIYNNVYADVSEALASQLQPCCLTP